MQNKKLYINIGVAILLIGIAAYIAGKMFNGKIGFAGLSGVNGGRVSVSLNDVTPAPELPTTRPDVTGMFVEKKDNSVIVSEFSFGAGVGSMSGDVPIDTSNGPKVEVVVTGKTIIYRETTQFNLPPAGERFSVQQTVEESTLDDLNPDTTVVVWGRRSGDRVIADVLFYSNPYLLKK